MDYLLFTYPHCQKCEDLKKYLKDTSLPAREYKVEEKEGRMKIREFLSHVRRDEKGSIILPTLILQKNGRVSSVMNTCQELEAWLKSRG
jgi:glutaredoxin